MNKLIEVTLEKIYDNIYKNINQNHINIFLCGGAKTNPNYIRDKVRDIISKDKNIRILYPEDMFIEMLNKDKTADLLTYEKFLADNSDYICIICESPGSLVELGAFVNNEKTFSKVIAIIDEKRKTDKSFILLGPIKLLRKHNKDNVIYFSNDNINTLSTSISKRVRKNYYKSSISNNIGSIIGLYNFIPIIIYFYNQLEFSSIVNMIEYILEKNAFKNIDIKSTLNPALRLLYKSKYLESDVVDGKQVYTLTSKGYENVTQLLNNLNIKNKTKLYDSIRFGIMSRELYLISSS